MENNLNENFTLSEEQIRFIDDGFIIKQKNLKDVIEKLVKQQNNNFQEKDVAQIIELYREIKKQEQVIAKQFKGLKIWTQVRLKKLKEEIKNKGKDIDVVALARDLKKTELFRSLDENLIIAKIFKLISELQKHEQIGLKQDKNKWTQEEIKIVEETIKEEIKNKGENINTSALSKKLAPKLKKHSYGSIWKKICEVIKRFKSNQEESNKSNNSYTIISEVTDEEVADEEVVDKEETTQQQFLYNLSNVANSMNNHNVAISEEKNEESNEEMFEIQDNIEYYPLFSDTSDSPPNEQNLKYSDFLLFSNILDDTSDLFSNESSSNGHSM